MEVVEHEFSRCFPDLTHEPAPDHNPSLQKPQSLAAGENNSAGFECNVCLGLASDPVVTICGHLFCWPCIYRWSHLESTQRKSPSLCPVCKSPFFESSLIPLYGCGIEGKSRNREIPDRPKDHRKLVGTASTVTGDDRRWDDRLPATMGRESGERMRGMTMGELRVEIWLNQLWIFMLCCAFLCLVFF